MKAQDMDYIAVIDSLAKRLGAGVVSFCPEFRGGLEFPDAPYDLDRVCRAFTGIVTWRSGSVCISPNYAGQALERAVQRTASFGTDNAASRDWDRLLAILEEDEIAQMSTADGLLLCELPEQRQERIDKILVPGLAYGYPSLAQPRERRLCAYVESSASVFGCGEVRVFWEWLGVAPARFTPASEWLAPNWAEMEYWSNCLPWTSQVLTVPITRVIRIAELPELFQPVVEYGAFEIGHNCADRRVAVSAGNWNRSLLLTFLQFSSNTQVVPRPSGRPRWQASRIDRLLRKAPLKMARSERAWMRTLGLVSRCIESPRTKLHGIPVDLLLEPQLLPFHTLTPVQQELVRIRAPFDMPPPSMRNNSGTECWLHPDVWFSVETNDWRQHTGGALTFPVDYAWLAARTALRLTA